MDYLDSKFYYNCMAKANINQP